NSSFPKRNSYANPWYNEIKLLWSNTVSKNIGHRKWHNNINKTIHNTKIQKGVGWNIKLKGSVFNFYKFSRCNSWGISVVMQSIPCWMSCRAVFKLLTVQLLVINPVFLNEGTMDASFNNNL